MTIEELTTETTRICLLLTALNDIDLESVLAEIGQFQAFGFAVLPPQEYLAASNGFDDLKRCIMPLQAAQAVAREIDARQKAKAAGRGPS